MSGTSEQDQATGLEIAVIGMDGRFPGAKGLEEYWANLSQGVESVRFFTREELESRGVAPRLLDHPRYVAAMSSLDEVELFDAKFFGMSPREATILDPQHRLFLESAYAALEQAGYVQPSYPGAIGVFGGASLSGYLANVLSDPSTADSVPYLQLLLSNDKDYLATRVSYKLDLEGPSVTVQTACSTALVAVHLACQSLLNGECDIALAGGVSVRVPQESGYLHAPDDIFSPDGHTRSFDADAGGTLFGSGVGVVALKRLTDALEDGDCVRAVIKGSAINNDGSEKAGFSAPSTRGQAEVVRAALDMAEVEPASISYIEAHGTATPLGDPIEIAALRQVFDRESETAPCAIGSVKSNFGHLDTAAGVAGLIKAILALEHRQIPPTLNFERPNPRIDLSASPLYVADALQDWKQQGAPRRAGVSSFGMGGTNAHVVLEEAPSAPASAPSRPWQQLLLSARTPTALEAATERLASYLRRHPERSLADVAHTLHRGRRLFDHRRVAVGRSVEEVASALEQRDRRKVLSGCAGESEHRLVFLLPGQGAQHVGMGHELYQSEAVFRHHVDRCVEILTPWLRADLLSLLYPAGAPTETASKRLAATEITQPALFVVEYALAQLWMSWGIRPQALIGHSLGEYVAACLAGIFELEDALAIVAARGRLMSRLPAGAMLSVPLGENEAGALAQGGLSLAAVNGTARCVLSGPPDEVEALQHRLEADGVEGRVLHSSHAFHSHMMDPILGEFRAVVARIAASPPRIPLLSNLTGTWITPEQATDPDYWVRQSRGTVRFAAGLEELLSEPDRILLEVGPGNTLASLARHQQGAASAEPRILTSLPHPRDPDAEHCCLLKNLGRLVLAGVEVDWDGYYGDEVRCRVPLPRYPFERQRFWLEGRRGELELAGGGARVGSQSGDRAQSEGRAQSGDGAQSGDRAQSEGLSIASSQSTLDESESHPTEIRLQEIWQQVLGLDRIDRQDHFFDLGGDSLLASQVTSRIRESLGVEVSVASMLEAPTIEELAAKLEARLGSELESQIREPQRRPRADTAPLSFAQERLWYLDRLHPENTAYNLPSPLRLNGPLDLAALRRSFGEVVRRHEILRTSFAEADNRPVQKIAPSLRLTLPVLDLSALRASDREVQVQSLALRDARTVFDLSRAPLLRLALLRLGETEHVLLLTMHHIVSDDWSMTILARELSALYEAFARGEASPLDEPPLQYGDFARWQREWLQGPTLSKELAYWREHIGRVEALPELPTDRPRRSGGPAKAGYLDLDLPAECTTVLRDLARQQGATLYMLLLTLFKVVLSWFAGRREAVVGTSIAERPRPELEALIGFFVNTLVLRSDLSGDPSFSELLGRVRDVCLGAFKHAELPFDKLVEDLQPGRSDRRAPLFEAFFVLHNALRGGAEARELELSPLWVGPGTVRYDLMLSISADREQVDGFFYYDAELFHATTVKRLAGHFETLARRVAESPDVTLAELLDLLGASDRKQRSAQRQKLRQSRLQRLKSLRVPATAAEHDNAGSRV
ncbi:MAG: condensation domain-containing protein [Acidobacteriota bacterium]